MVDKSPKERIVEAGIMEFAKNYYDAASINNIIKVSRTSKGTFYHYFKDKEDLYFYILDIVVQEKIRYISKRMGEMSDMTQDISLFDNNFKKLVSLGMEFAAENPLYYDIGMNMLHEPNMEILDRITSKYGDQTRSIIGIVVDKSIENNELNSHLPRDFIVSVVSFIMSNYVKLIPPEDRTNFESWTKHLDSIFEFIENGILNRENTQ